MVSNTFKLSLVSLSHKNTNALYLMLTLELMQLGDRVCKSELEKVKINYCDQHIFSQLF